VGGAAAMGAIGWCVGCGRLPACCTQIPFPCSFPRVYFYVTNVCAGRGEAILLFGPCLLSDVRRPPQSEHNNSSSIKTADCAISVKSIIKSAAFVFSLFFSYRFSYPLFVPYFDQIEGEIPSKIGAARVLRSLRRQLVRGNVLFCVFMLPEALFVKSR